MITNSLPYKIVLPKAKKRPMILSIPHCGTAFPSELSEHYIQDQIYKPDDTDWFLEMIYDFASELGITTIHAIYSRWVIDLNRTPENTSLYNDGRIITALCPTTDFFDRPIYKQEEFEPTNKEINRRLDQYFWPYHNKIDELINNLKAEFSTVLFWDAHSIRRKVDKIRKDPFPDLILGDNDNKTAHISFIETALNALSNTGLEVKHNQPFKGGHITPSKGDPDNNVHALQLEMAKDLYMSDNETVYDKKKAENLKQLLESTFHKLIKLL